MHQNNGDLESIDNKIRKKERKEGKRRKEKKRNQAKTYKNSCNQYPNYICQSKKTKGCAIQVLSKLHSS